MPINLQILLACILNWQLSHKEYFNSHVVSPVDKSLTIALKRASVNLFNKQGPRRQQQERHLETKLCASAIISRLFHVFFL